MQVRTLQPHELQDLLALYSHLHESDDSSPDQGVIESVWQELVSSPRFVYFGGFSGEALVSSCTISVIPNLTRGCRPYGLIENVVTHASHRGRGFGKAVLSAALQHAWSVGCYKVMLLTGRKTESTFRFYESAGFSRHEKQAFIAKPAA